ncbi:hypothetical protein [Flavobacterium tegetincola]|uniref:hypothetical protein n=1 Tax=Flavobacterium tegetincola TaxID=150172 RepID=UPI00054ED7D0|nr:hypothetical protein [Flavobacterium tegetincola]
MRFFYVSIVFFLFIVKSFSQVGVNTITPEGALDVKSTSQGVLLPRVNLLSETDDVTVTNPEGGALVVSTLVYNLGTAGLSPAGFYYWEGTKWSQLMNNNPNTFSGEFIISATGNVSITGIPFKPSRVTFTAYPNVETDNSSTNPDPNDITEDNSFGFMNGYALSFSGSVTQQVIYGGGSGNSINGVSNYSSDSHCIGLRYSNRDGVAFGITSAAFTSFDADGFSINVDSLLASENVMVIFEAYK